MKPAPDLAPWPLEVRLGEDGQSGKLERWTEDPFPTAVQEHRAAWPPCSSTWEQDSSRSSSPSRPKYLFFCCLRAVSPSSLKLQDRTIRALACPLRILGLAVSEGYTGSSPYLDTMSSGEIQENHSTDLAKTLGETRCRYVRPMGLSPSYPPSTPLTLELRGPSPTLTPPSPAPLLETPSPHCSPSPCPCL